jgi:hypothetical protein
VEGERFVQSASIVPAEHAFLKFSISRLWQRAECPSEEIWIHLGLELLCSIQQYHGNPEAVSLLEIVVAIDEDFLKAELSLLELSQDHLPGFIAQSAPPPRIHGELSAAHGWVRVPEGAGAGRRCVAVRKPQYITATPAARVTEKPAKFAAAAKAAPAATTVAPSTTRRVP